MYVQGDFELWKVENVNKILTRELYLMFYIPFERESFQFSENNIT